MVAAVVPEGERSAYLPFARELRATLRLQPPRFLDGTGHDPECRTLGSCPSPVKSPPRVLDFSRSTKRVVMRWFRRGLSGRLMRLVGQRLIEQLFPQVKDGRVQC
jgi:hypothetical protein